MVCKDDFVDWFHKLSGSKRIDVMVTLLEVCVPLEIRFFGTVIENLGRRDYHTLREVDHRANDFLQTSRTGIVDKLALLTNALMDTPIPLSSPCSNVNFPHAGPPLSTVYNNIVVSNSQQTSTLSSSSVSSCSSDVSVTSVTNNRPSLNQHPDKVRLPGNCQQDQQLPQSDGAHHQFHQGGRQQQQAGDNNGGGDSGGNKDKTFITLNIQNSENKEEKSDKSILVDDTTRKRLILYLCVLTANNRECANVYYKVLSEVQSLDEVAGWAEGMDDTMLNEMALLYTISSNHPAFTFDQRSKLNEYGIKFRSLLSKSELPKISTQAATQYIATPIPTGDPKIFNGQYFLQYVPCIPYPGLPMPWQNLSGSQPPSQPNQALVIPYPNQSSVNVQSHLSLSQPPETMTMMNHINCSSNSSTVPTASSITYSPPSQRSVCSSSTSISPPPRSQKTSSSQKISQNIQTRMLPKNAQDIEVSMASLNNVNVPFSSQVPVSVNCMTGKQPINCVVSANNLNGMKQPLPLPPDPRAKSSLVTMTNLMNSFNLNNTSPIVTTSSSSSCALLPSSAATSQCPSLIQTIVPSAISCPSSYPTNVANSSGNSSQTQISSWQQQQPPPVRRQPANNVVTTPHHMHHHHPPPPTSTSSHFNPHSQPPLNNTFIVPSNNLSQFSKFTFPFSVPQFTQQPPPPQPSIPTSKGINNNATLTAATPIPKQITSQAPCNQNGGKMNISANNDVVSPLLFGGHSCSSQQQPNSHIHNGIKLVNHDCATTFSLPNLPSAAPQLPNTSVVPPQTSRSRGVLLEVGGGQDVTERIDGTSFFAPLEYLVVEGSRPKMSCYNCGSHNHYGPDCKENTMEELTKHPYRINFLPEASPQETKGFRNCDNNDDEVSST